MADINLVSIIMHRRDQSNFVASNIEHREFSNLVGLRKSLAQLREIQKTALSHNRVPTREGRFGIRVFFRELVQALPCNDVHYWSATLTETFPGEKRIEQRGNGGCRNAGKPGDVEPLQMFDLKANKTGNPLAECSLALGHGAHYQQDEAVATTMATLFRQISS